MAKKPEYEEDDTIKLQRARFNALLECFCEAFERLGPAGRGLDNATAVGVAMELEAAAFIELFKPLRESNMSEEEIVDEGDLPEAPPLA